MADERWANVVDRDGGTLNICGSHGSLCKPSHASFPLCLSLGAVCKNAGCVGKEFNLNLISLRRTNRLIPLDAHTMGPREIAFAARIYSI